MGKMLLFITRKFITYFFRKTPLGYENLPFSYFELSWKIFLQNWEWEKGGKGVQNSVAMNFVVLIFCYFGSWKASCQNTYPR